MSRTGAARAALLATGAADLQRHPWQHPNEAPDATTLARFALWRASDLSDSTRTEALEAGLALIDLARSDLDSLETALVFSARAEGLTWARIAEIMGLRSPQAAQQRFQRAAERPTATQNDVPTKGESHAGD